jgi:hypothetical protein
LKARAGWKETHVTETTGTQTLQLQHLVAAREINDRLPVLEGKIATPATAAPDDDAEPDFMRPALE